MFNKLGFVLGIVIFLFGTVFGTGCNQSARQSKVMNVGLLFGSGGLGDRSFNDSAYAGLLEAQKKYNIRFETIDKASLESNLDSLRLFARNNYDLIIGVAFENLECIRTVAAEYPDVHFAAIDFELGGDNIASIVYREQEADFLMGVLGAMLTETKRVAVIGGMDIPAIQRIMSGYKQGAAFQDPLVEVITDFAGTFSDSEIGLAMALNYYSQGVDIIHNAASRTGLGIIQAAQQTGKLTTGTSGDQRYLAPGHVVGNRPKRVDTAVELLVREVAEGTFESGIRSLGLSENGLTLGPFDETLVSQSIFDRIEFLKQQIIDGIIAVRAD